jgi:hypothetical protein
MELFMTVLAWGFQIGVTLLISCAVAGIIGLVVKGISIKSTKHSFIIYFSASFCLIIGLISYIAYHPIIICPEEYKNVLTEEMKSDIIAYNSGFYSARLPIFPFTIKVLSAHDKNVTVQTNYLYLGNTQMEIIDGLLSIIKPLN